MKQNTLYRYVFGVGGWIYIFLLLAVCFTLAAVYPSTMQAEDIGGYDVSLTSRGDIQPGEFVSFRWNVQENESISKDWIGVFRVGDSNRQFLSWEYVQSRSGNSRLRVPTEEGNYELRYLKSDGFASVTQSEPFQVRGEGTSDEYSITVSPRTIQPGGTITVRWEAPRNVSIRNDWVAVYSVGGSNRNFNDWKYVRDRSGSVTLRVPNTPGTYEVRYLKNDRFTAVVTSERITVEGRGTVGETYSVRVSETTVRPGLPITVRWETQGAEDRRRDWVAVYRIGASNSAYLSWKYVGQENGTITLTAPIDPGGYEVRYLKNDGFTVAARSGQFEVVRGEVGDNPKIIAFGDSLVAGFGATAGNDFVSRLEALSGQDIENQGRNGDTTARALNRIERDVLRKDPDIVILLVGGNDTLQDIPRSVTLANVRTMVQRIQESGATVILVGIHSVVYSESYRQIAIDEGTYFVPEVLSGILGRDDLTVDRVHPNNAGYQIVANRIYSVLRTLL